MDAVLIIIAGVLALLFFESGAGTSASDNGGSVWADYSNTPGGTVTGGTSKLAQAIAKIEGFFVPGSLPARTHNPGDINTYGGKVGSYPTDAAGFSALENYITQHATKNPSWDFYDFAHYYLTGDTLGQGGQGQNPDGYAEFLASQLGVDPTTPISSVLG